MIDKMVSRATDFFTRLNKRQRWLFMGAVFMLGLCVLDFGFFQPVVFKLKELDDDIEARKTHILRDYSMLAHEETIIDEAEQLRVYFDPAHKEEDEVLSDLLRVIENLAIQKSITISNIRPGSLEDKAIARYYSTTLDCEGTLRDILEFMNALEESTYLFRIDSYDLTPKDKDGKIIKCNMLLSKNIVVDETE